MREMFQRSGQVGHDLLAVDWEATPLGPLETWPQSLQSVVRLMLTSRFSMWMAWGPDLTFFCNDAYRLDTLGVKYPWALGRPAQEVWSEIWSEVWPRIDAVMTTGEATWDKSLMLFLERSGYTEESFHTFSYSPIFDDRGRINGMFCVVSEDTEDFIANRRMQTLRDLGSRRTSNLEVGGDRRHRLPRARGERRRPAVHAGLPLRRRRVDGPAGRVPPASRATTRPRRPRSRWPTATPSGRSPALAGGPCGRRPLRAGSTVCRPAPGRAAAHGRWWCRCASSRPGRTAFRFSG